ncbi:hypothetical protein N9O57_00465 [bacterium]|nr:hypothetical protein [bacterium]
MKVERKLKCLFLLSSFILLSSCSFLSREPLRREQGEVKKSSNIAPRINSGIKKTKFSLKTTNLNYELTDKAGNFNLNINEGLTKKGNAYATKTIIYEHSKTQSVLEKTISLSKMGKLGRSFILRPEVSEHSVWFSGEKYFTRIRLLADKRALSVKLTSPEDKWNKSFEVSLPKSSKLFCFFSQVIACSGKIGFIEKAIAARSGKMDFQVIWESYPYFTEQYLNMPEEVFSDASLSFDEITPEGHFRFNFTFEGQSIFYDLDENLKLVKKFWVVQGYTLLRK